MIISFNILAISVIKDNKNIDKFLNFILLLVLIFLEPDGFYFHETYDPLLYFVFLLLINSQQFLLFVEKLNFKNLIILFSFELKNFYKLSKGERNNNFSGDGKPSKLIIPRAIDIFLCSFSNFIKSD